MKCHVALTPPGTNRPGLPTTSCQWGTLANGTIWSARKPTLANGFPSASPCAAWPWKRWATKVDFTYEANPGEVWEENEWWIQLSAEMDPDGSLGMRQYFESPYRDGEIITVDEYYQWQFENAVPGLPEAAEKEGLTPLEYMRKYGAFEVTKENYVPYEKELDN